jgi:HK97 family phage major capsid protein
VEIRTLIDDLNTVATQAKALHDEFAGKEWPAEKREEWDRLLARAAELRTKIQDAEKLASQAKDLGEIGDFLSRPQYRIPRGVGEGSDETKSALQKAGWELKAEVGGKLVWHAPTSKGLVAMYAAEVLDGPMPEDDPDAFNFFKSARAACQPGYRDAYMRYLHNIIKTRSEGMAFAMLSGAEQKALSEGSDTSGGFLVPPDVQAELLVRVAQVTVMRKYARVQTTSRDKLTWPRVQPHATQGSIFSSGFVGSWAGETPAFSDTDPLFGTFDIAIKKIRVVTKLSNDFVSDAAINVLAWLAQNGAENMALVEDQGFIVGDGSALQPKGILNAGATTVDVEGSTANTISNTTAAAGSAPKLIDLVYALPSQYAARATHLMCRSIEGKIRKLVDAQGRFHWPLTASGGFGPTPRELMGYPIDNSEFVPNDGTDQNKVLVFGDLSQYIIAQRAQVTTAILRERFADTDQIGIVLFERVGGDLWNTDAIRVGVV